MQSDFRPEPPSSHDDFGREPMRGDLARLRKETAAFVMRTYDDPTYNPLTTAQIEAKLSPQLGWLERATSHSTSLGSPWLVKADSSLSQAIQSLGNDPRVLAEAKTLETQAEQKELVNVTPSTRPRPAVLKV